MSASPSSQAFSTFPVTLKDTMKLTLIAALLCAATTLAQAESFTSSASSAATTGISASSKSINASSESSSGEDKKVAAGVYQVTAVTAVAAAPDSSGSPGTVRLALKGDQGQADFTLDLPASTVQAQALAVGHKLLVQERAFGYAFALPTAPQQPFFLALAQGWEAEMQSKRVSL